MSETTVESATPSTGGAALDQGTYEVLRARLETHGAELRTRLEKLNAARKSVFGAIGTTLLATERVTTHNNCTPRDMIPIGDGRFLLGYNVHLGLRTDIKLEDVFAVYQYRDRTFQELPLDGVADPTFQADFKSLYKYYREAKFTKFSIMEPHLFMEFRIGRAPTDVKTFKWLYEGEQVRYLGNRFDHEYTFPPAYEFEWTRTHRELHRYGLHPHISIEDRLFVECIKGDLTIKIEDNTDTGEGVYSEPVDQPDQTLDDAEIFYAIIGSLILLKIRPYQEPSFRYLVYNEKLKEVRRIDAIADACVLLPADHGIIFSSGYYLQSGEYKLFETGLEQMTFYKRIASPNGEDTLYAFYNFETGDYILLSYNVISRTVATPHICSGFSLFENGELAVFRADAQPQRHHAVQLWQTPYVGPSWQPEQQPSSYLFKVGNAALVGAMAECQQVLTLLGKNDSYAGLYLDLVRQAGTIIDSYFWLDHEEACGLRAPLIEIKQAAASALAEFEKVATIKRATAKEATRVLGGARELLQSLKTDRFEQIGAYVAKLSSLRSARGELGCLRELRYIELPLVDEMEREVAAATESFAARTVEFLLGAEALAPLRLRVQELQGAVPKLTKATEAQKLEQEIAAVSGELDLLIETVSNLKIADATETTRLVEGISAIYATLNQARTALKQRLRELRGTEAVAEFGSQTQLLDQALTNYLDFSTTPEKCDEYVNRLMVQVEELEARFADFEDFVVELSEKRTAIAGAFEGRKIELIEARNRKAGALLTAAERILKAVKHRADNLDSLAAINGYFASDLMVEKVREQIAQLLALGDTVKADDLQTRLKTVREDAARQLRDRQDLFAGGANSIQLGRHRFLVNTQELDLTVVPRGETRCLHLTGTNFFEPIVDEVFLATKPVWGLEVISETPEIYRAEYLAFQLLETVKPAEAVKWSEEERLAQVREQMAARHTEGYVKGVHDLDAAKILGALLEIQQEIGLLRYPATARACAAVFWQQFPEGEQKTLLEAKLQSFATVTRLFPSVEMQAAYVRELQGLLQAWAQRTGLFAPESLADAAEYLYFQLKQGPAFIISQGAANLTRAFREHLTAHGFAEAFQSARAAVSADLVTSFELLRDWLRGFIGGQSHPEWREYLDEAASLLLRDRALGAEGVDASVTRDLEGLLGQHALIEGGRMRLHFVRFVAKLRAHAATVAPVYARYQELKRQLISEARERLGLDHFKPKVLTSFVRNRLIDSAYLPLVGENLAKQIGSAGETKRTDRMGLLLLVSPPGYGKTTLAEYLASRLGIVFLKVNGPAIGHRVTSLDPAEAPNAAAREELAKLNLAFEMGDNVMVCLDDIQHLNPEFLQKFISLCDGSRRIEGVYRGEPRVYDLRGRKVAVVMAGNPYTESGALFRVPDMLANRADTYNLGDVVGAHAEVFKSSYIENAATSNPDLARVAARSQRDVLTLLKLTEAGPGEGIEFDGTYSPAELNDLVNVLRKMLRVRDVILRVNEEYIRSAAQADNYRTEPAFKLQGSYRNMNRLAEKISAVMNDAEVQELILQHYRNEAQTLTSGAEANLLKLRELLGILTPEESARWAQIRDTFRKNQLLRGGDEHDPVSQVVRQLAACFEGIDSIRKVLELGLKDGASPAPAASPVTLIMAPLNGQPPSAVGATVDEMAQGIREMRIDAETLAKIWELIESRKVEGVDALAAVPQTNGAGGKAPVANSPM